MSFNKWANLRVGITGSTGSLGKALTKVLKEKGAIVLGLTHSPIPKQNISESSPHKWVQWKCGEEDNLDNTFENLDILILNHGINPKGPITNQVINEALEINALSTWKLIENFSKAAFKNGTGSKPKELWINTSEAEIQPALSPAYEISKRLLGQLLSLSSTTLNKDQKNVLKIRKLILGPFRSKLNPIGIMTPKFVAEQILIQVELQLSLVIVTPNPLTYLIMPITEISRLIYFKLISFSGINNQANQTN